LGISDCIQSILAFLTLAGLASLWLIPRMEEEKRNQNTRKLLIFYLGIFEEKFAMELSDIKNKKSSAITNKEFEEENQANYQTLERLINESTDLHNCEYSKLIQTLRVIKTSPKITTKNEVEEYIKIFEETQQIISKNMKNDK